MELHFAMNWSINKCEITVHCNMFATKNVVKHCQNGGKEILQRKFCKEGSATLFNTITLVHSNLVWYRLWDARLTDLFGISKATKRSRQLSNLVTVEVHCCIVSLIRKELLEEITAEIHSFVQDVLLRRPCNLVTLMLGVWILFALAGAAVCIPPETISRRLIKQPTSFPLGFYAP